jgi:septum site-determining protein MinC
MSAVKHHVAIKGVKDGLVFLLDDACEFEEVIKELKLKLESTHNNILTGPIIHVNVKLGSRQASDEQKEHIRSIIRQKGNLLIQSITADELPKKNETAKAPRVSMMSGIIRSGQTVRHEGNLLYTGDVNPGGSIECTGSIYILGSLRGMAHAGLDGDEGAVIAASHLRPTQLRIAGVISRPPDEWGVSDTFMEFAYIKDGQMQIDKVHQLHRIFPATASF